MIFSGLFLLGEIPFADVIITSTVLAVDGRRMSKSLGTGIDPLEAVDKHGADATRYGLLKISSTQDVRFSWGAIEEGQKLANKLWNVSRLILQHADGQRRPTATPSARGELDPARGSTRRARELEELLPRFDFAHVADALYHLIFDDFCDWYAEAIKPRLYGSDEAAIATALAALERLLALLHPVMPHVTEEIWSQFHRHAADRRAVARARPPSIRPPATPWPASRKLRRSSGAAGVARRRSRATRSAIFDAVVKPERRQGRDGDVEAERERLRKEIARSEAHARERAVRRGARPRRSSRPSARSSSATSAS